AVNALRRAWNAPRGNRSVTTSVLDAMRTGTPVRACSEALRHLIRGKAAAAGAIWDAVHLAAVELAVRGNAAGSGVHEVTSANALHQAFLCSQDPRTQLLLLLQAVGWMGQFKNLATTGRQGLRDQTITDLTPANLPRNPDQAVAQTLAEV